MDTATLEASSEQIGQTSSNTNLVGRKVNLIGSDLTIDLVRIKFKELEIDDFITDIKDQGNCIENFNWSLSGDLEDINLLLCSSQMEKDAMLHLNDSNAIIAVIDKDLQKYGGFNFSNLRPIAVQQHCKDVALTELQYENQVRLSEVRYDIQKAEVKLRSVNTAIVNLDAIRLSDNLGSKGSMTTGMTIEEMCHIAKYVGASTHLKNVAITGYDANNDPFDMVKTNMALVIWYLLNGNKIRKRELEDIAISENTYTLIPDDFDTELTFIENTNSGRWWVKLPSDLSKEEIKIACTKQDYEDACQNVISDRLMDTFAKY